MSGKIFTCRLCRLADFSKLVMSKVVRFVRQTNNGNVIDLIFTLILCVRLLVFEVSLGYMVDHFKNVAHLSAKYRAEERTLPTHSLMEIILL